MKYNIMNEEVVFDGFFQIKKATIKHDSFDSHTVEVERLCLDRGDSVAIVLYEKDSDSLLFTNQFRYPTIKENGWIVEIAAGSVEPGDVVTERVKKEVQEEVGYQVKGVEFISSFFVSPGGTSERIWLYYVEVTSADKVHEGGGMKLEKEDIELVRVKSKDAKEQLINNQFRDAKTIIGLQWFYLNK